MGEAREEGDAVAERRTQKQRREEAQRAMVAAATELIGRNGYGATTFEEIGRLSGVSRGLVTYHFGSKLNCIRAVVAEIRAYTLASLDAGAEGLRGLRGLDHTIETYLRLYESDSTRERALFVTMVEAVSATPDLIDLITEQDNIFRQLLIDRIDEAKADGEVPASVDSSAIAVLIVGLLRGVALQWMVSHRAVDFDTVIPVAQRMAAAAVGTAVP